MKNRIPVTIAAVLLVLSVSAIAQEIPKIELAGGYSYMNVNPNISQITSQNFNGGGGAAVFNLTPLLGIKADFMGYAFGTGWTKKLINQGFPVTGSASGNLFTYMFGPQIKKHSGKYQFFGEGLFGAAHSNGYGSILRCVSGNDPTSCNLTSGNGNKGARHRSENLVGFFFWPIKPSVYNTLGTGGPPMTHSLSELEKRRAQLLAQISQLADFRPGSITATQGRCGNPNCHCHQPGHPGHGPNLRLTYKVEGKTVTESFATPAAQRKAEREVAEFTRYRELSRDFVAVNLEICRARPVEETLTPEEKKRRKPSTRRSPAK